MAKYALRPVDRSDIHQTGSAAANICEFLDHASISRGRRIVRVADRSDAEFIVAKFCDFGNRWVDTKAAVRLSTSPDGRIV